MELNRGWIGSYCWYDSCSSPNPLAPDADYATSSGRQPAASLGHLASRTCSSCFTTERKFTAKLTKAVRREKARADGSDNGVFGTKRDLEFGMVPADRADDDEHWSLDTRRGMDRGRDGKIYQGA